LQAPLLQGPDSSGSDRGRSIVHDASGPPLLLPPSHVLREIRSNKELRSVEVTVG
jgi:hypothetical protein